jgi:hypothetical protein
MHSVAAVWIFENCSMQSKAKLICVGMGILLENVYLLAAAA